MVKSILLLLIAMSSIQVGATVAKGIFPVLGPAGTTALRIFFAALIMWIFFKPWRYKLTKAQFKRVSVYGLCLGFMNLTFYFSLERIPLGLAVALEFTGPLAVAIFTSGKKIDYLWAILAGAGIYLIIPVLGGSSSIDLFGASLALLAGAFWAGYILFGKSASSNVPETLTATWGMSFAALVALPAGIFSAGNKLIMPETLPIAFGVAILSSAIPYTLEMFVLKKIPTKTFGVLMSLEPVIASIAGLLFLHEALLPAQYFAISLIMISSIGSSLSAR